jgi:hypothetical protein
MVPIWDNYLPRTNNVDAKNYVVNNSRPTGYASTRFQPTEISAGPVGPCATHGENMVCSKCRNCGIYTAGIPHCASCAAPIAATVLHS